MFGLAPFQPPVRFTSVVGALVVAALTVVGLPADALQHQFASAAPAAAAATSVVYAADSVNNAVWVYTNPPPTALTNAAPVTVKPTRAIFLGPNQYPTGITVDSHGYLYVADLIGTNVSVFAPGGSIPVAVYSQGLTNPYKVKVSQAGLIYVLNMQGTVVVYQPLSSLNPIPTIAWQTPANLELLDLALQSPDYAPGGDVYVSYVNQPSGASGVLWCPVGSTTCFDSGVSGTQSASSLAFQYNKFPLTLLVGDYNNNAVNIYHLHHGLLPAARLSVPRPVSLAFDSSFTNLFVAVEPWNAANVVNEYRYPAGTLAAVLMPGAALSKSLIPSVAIYPAAGY